MKLKASRDSSNYVFEGLGYMVKRKLWIRQDTHKVRQDTQFPHGMNHKITRKRDLFITFPYRSNATKAFKMTRNIYTKVHAMYPSVLKGQLMCSYKRSKKVADYLVTAKLK